MHLLKSLKMLDTFLSRREDLFLGTDLEVVGFKVQSDHTDIQPGNSQVCSLYYTDEDFLGGPQSTEDQQGKESSDTHYEQLLDQKIFDEADEGSLLRVYVVNPDLCIIFGDLITEVLGCVKKWRETREGSVVVDYAQGKIRPL